MTPSITYDCILLTAYLGIASVNTAIHIYSASVMLPGWRQLREKDLAPFGQAFDNLMAPVSPPEK